jgi:hypothetical protein
MDTSPQTTQHPNQQQNSKSQGEPKQDSEEDIEAVIEDELARLRQENEHLQLIQEQMARRKALVKRAHVMHQQIKQERVIQAELQQAIEHLRHQEGAPVVQETPLQQYQPQQP